MKLIAVMKGKLNNLKEKLNNFINNLVSKYLSIEIKRLFSKKKVVSSSAFAMACSMLATPTAAMDSFSKTHLNDLGKTTYEECYYYENIRPMLIKSLEINCVAFDNKNCVYRLRNDVCFSIPYHKNHKPEIVKPTDPKDMNLDQKVDWILEEYNLTLDQFCDIVATVYAEGGFGYTEDQAVVSTMINRKDSIRFTKYVSSVLNDEELGHSLYGQLICPNQYAFNNHNCIKYKEQGYEFLKSKEGFLGIVECLCFGAIHDYMSFRGYEPDFAPEAVNFTSNGNYFFSVLTDEDRIIPEPEETAEEEIEEEVEENNGLVKDKVEEQAMIFSNQKQLVLRNRLFVDQCSYEVK